MAVAIRSNGLHHAVSLGTFEVSSNAPNFGNFDRNYDSEDENISRRRLRHTSSTQLYARASVYSKGDIREQYCLTDRQLNSIERPRRSDRFFGCLSRRSTQQSFLGVCVGRRIPSDDNLAAYAPFNKSLRYSHEHRLDDKIDSDVDSSYFRRQPASILSTSKMADTVSQTKSRSVGSWIDGCDNQNLSYTVSGTNHSAYHCSPEFHLTTPTEPTILGGTGSSRTKHVSFARSHTLTSIDDVNIGLRSSWRLKEARSQERLIGGKKPLANYETNYETNYDTNDIANIPQIHQTLIPATPNLLLHRQPVALHQHEGHMLSTYPHEHGHTHTHLHGHIPLHKYISNPPDIAHLQRRQSVNEDEINIGVLMCPAGYQALTLQNPEVVVVEKKFRNAMKTQATQTEVRRVGPPAHGSALSPKTGHKVKVVSQGAQTNGGADISKKLAKSLSEIPYGNMNSKKRPISEEFTVDHDLLIRTQSEEPSRSPLDSMQMYYKPLPPYDISTYDYSHTVVDNIVNSIDSGHMEEGRFKNCRSNPVYQIQNGDTKAPALEYVSNSLPRRVCNCHRVDVDFSSNSLPRNAEGTFASSHQEICKHVTECTELLGKSMPLLDFNRTYLLPPPHQYCHKVNIIDNGELTGQKKNIAVVNSDQLRLSEEATNLQELELNDNPFQRCDTRRQSMPIYIQTEKLIDGYTPRSSFRSMMKPKLLTLERAPDEQEIFIDFKPHLSPQASPGSLQAEDGNCIISDSSDLRKDRKCEFTSMEQEDEEDEYCDSSESASADDGSECVSNVGDEDEEENVSNFKKEAKHVLEANKADNSELLNNDGNCTSHNAHEEDPLYENIVAGCPREVFSFTIDSHWNTNYGKADGMWRRSISLDETNCGIIECKNEASAPPSPYRDELLVNTSTYPSSDSLTIDATRDHSDGIWNESQVTVLTALDQKDLTEDSFSSNLLTPSSKRKNLILQHQQRSSIDTDALDFEEQLGETTPTYINIGKKHYISQLRAISNDPKEHRKTLFTPSIAVTPSINESTGHEVINISPKKSLKSCVLPLDKNSESPIYCGKIVNADVSECSTTNTDEYATCTDTSKKTPGTKTPKTATSSSSTTQVPVSTQSSQIDKTHGGSSFESASSLFSTRGDLLSDELAHRDGNSFEKAINTTPTLDIVTKSPTNSLSSTSSGSYNVAGIPLLSSTLNQQQQIKDQSKSVLKELPALEALSSGGSKQKLMPRSISDDEHSEMRNSSSGYYESPHEEENVTKARRHTHHFHRLDEERKKRKSSMKLDIEKENIRALTSPIKRPLLAPPLSATLIIPVKEFSPQRHVTGEKKIPEITPSLNKIKRYRPKIRRQFRKSSRDELGTNRQQNDPNNLYSVMLLNNTGIMMECGKTTASNSDVKKEVSLLPTVKPIEPEPHPSHRKSEMSLKSKDINSLENSADVSKLKTNTCGLKAKSVESLRSVSPGSDSVFYSEADGNDPDQQSHCLHCGKDVDSVTHSATNFIISGDSIESLPCIENDMEQDIVKPPSDFADSPVTTKSSQRLYKKIDKRFRSEERYHTTDRGRLYKTRQENIRAKSEERSRDNNIRTVPSTLRPAGSSPCMLPDANLDRNQNIIYRGHYDPARYTRLTDTDVWKQLNHENFDRRERDRDRSPSTISEHNFRSKYQVILHRLVQRRCTLEMYHRQNNNTFQLVSSNSARDSVRGKLQEIIKLMLMVWARESCVLSGFTFGQHGIDKTIVVNSDSGEFGFRIHGSKPVVVAAIEPETPAESSGLEVGDIIISVNGVQVLDKHHTEVVKIAHDGCEKLELQVARTIGILMNEKHEPNCQAIYSGFLWRQSGQAKGAPNAKKWVRRWFCLRPDNCLYYYKTQDDIQPVGAMIMAKHIIEKCSSEIGKPFAFKVDSGEGIPLYVAADTEELAQHWINLLQQSATQGTSWLDKCSRNLYKQPSSIAKPDCFGYLLKLGSRWCGWSKRYCVLKDASLYFYQDANSKSAFGMACLQGYKVASMSTNTAGKKNSFEIIPPETKLRHYYFSTETEMDKKRWVSALEYSIDRWIKSG